MSIRFDPHLLSFPTWGYNAENLRQIGEWLIEKMHRSGLRKYPKTKNKVFLKHLEFMELYERAKIQEKENKEEGFVKTNNVFYRPRFANRYDQYLFERLEDRRKTSILDRRNSNISKV
jgi:hypothetical protein